MIHARSLLPAGTWSSDTAVDRVVLPHDGRHRQRIAMRGEGDVVFLLDLPEATRLKDGDGLALDDGRVVAVAAAAEPVAEFVVGEPLLLARIAWQLGARHVPAELLADRVRIARDPAIEQMARELGAEVVFAEAAFEPEAGAQQAAEAHGHAHGHHAHEHHAHGDACGCGHDHGEHAHHEHKHGEHSHGEHHHEHAHGKHDHGTARDVLHVHDHDDAHAHAHGDACGCGHDHGEHKHDEHKHGDHHHDHAHHDHGHRRG